MKPTNAIERRPKEFAALTFTISTRPISGNRRLMPSRGRMVSNPDYRTYKELVYWAARKAVAASEWKMVDAVAVTIGLGPSCARLDLDAPIKVLLDGMESIVYRNDKAVQKLTVVRTIDAPVTICVEALE